MKAPFIYDPDADIEERCQIYLGRKEGANLYTRGVLGWFYYNSSWIEMTKPSDEDIRENLRDFIEHQKPWTEDLNEADCWNGYWIDKFQKFLPEIEWRKAILTTVPIDHD